LKQKTSVANDDEECALPIALPETQDSLFS